MSDLAAQLKRAEQERLQLEAKVQEMWRRLFSSIKQSKATLDYAEKQLKQLEAKPTFPGKERELLLASLRREGAQNNLTLLESLQTLDISQPLSTEAVQQFDNLCARTQFIAAEFNLLRYVPVLEALNAVLDGPAEEPSAAIAPTTKGGRLAPLGRPGGVGLPPSPGTGPLGAKPPRPSVPPRPVGGARPPTLTRPTGGTSPLPRMPMNPRTQRGGTQSLAADSALREKIESELRPLVVERNLRNKLLMLRDRVRDVEASVKALRGDAMGVISGAVPEPLQTVRQLSGKVYMVGRAVAELGDAGKLLAFESPELDQSLLAFVQAVESRNAPASAEAEARTANRLEIIKGLFRP